MINVEMKSRTSRGVESIIQSQAFDSYVVSTKYVGDGSSHSYETLVFRYSMLYDRIDDLDEYDAKTYSNERDAKIGHAKMVNKWQNEIRDITEIKHYYDYD